MPWCKPMRWGKPMGEEIETLVECDEWQTQIKQIEEYCEKITLHTLKNFEPPFGAINILLCDDAKIQNLNLNWRKIDKPTNVLSFEHVGNAAICGDIALAYETCFNEASSQNKSFENHVAHLIVHGVLHLLGYDHIDDEEAVQMETLEAEILQGLGISNPYLVNQVGTLVA